MAVDWTTWKPRLLYGAFFALAFLFALRQTLPASALKERLVQEAAQRGWKLDAAEAGPAGLIGLHLGDVTLKDRAGLAIPLDRLDVSLRPLALLVGRTSLALTAGLWDGTAKANVDVTGSPQRIELTLAHLDLAQAVPLRKAAGLDLAGLASGTAQLTVPADDKVKATGHADLTVADAGLIGGKLTVPGMGGELTVPKLSLGQLTAKLQVADGKATFEKLSSSGGDASLEADGLQVALQPKLEFSPIVGKVAIRVEEAFAAKAENKGFKALLDAALGSSKGKDGAYRLQLSGTLSHPQAKPLVAGP
jgi:type II secretion system protein N